MTGGESLERVFWHELQAKHWPDLEQRLAPTYVLITPDGTFDRDRAIEHWKQLEIKEYSLGEVKTEGKTAGVRLVDRREGLLRVPGAAVVRRRNAQDKTHEEQTSR